LAGFLFSKKMLQKWQKTHFLHPERSVSATCSPPEIKKWRALILKRKLINFDKFIFMSEIFLTQQEADDFIALQKIRIDDSQWSFPAPGGSISIPIISNNEKEEFLLDIGRYSNISISKITYPNRMRKTIILLRLDFADINKQRTHRNPDGSELFGTHIHIYSEGFADKWAYELKDAHFPIKNDYWLLLDDFMKYCNIIKPPIINKGLF